METSGVGVSFFLVLEGRGGLSLVAMVAYSSTVLVLAQNMAEHHASRMVSETQKSDGYKFGIGSYRMSYRYSSEGSYL